MSIRKNKWVFNSILLITGTIASLSGIAIQIGYHAGSPDSITKASRTILGFGYADWSMIHKIAIVIFALSSIYHIYVHRKWYKAVLKKPSLRKQNKQVLLLSLFFILSAITGIIPWAIDSFGTDQVARTTFIEIHDKISLILVAFMVLHISRRKQLLVQLLKINQ